MLDSELVIERVFIRIVVQIVELVGTDVGSRPHVAFEFRDADDITPRFDAVVEIISREGEISIPIALGERVSNGRFTDLFPIDQDDDNGIPQIVFRRLPVDCDAAGKGINRFFCLAESFENLFEEPGLPSAVSRNRSREGRARQSHGREPRRAKRRHSGAPFRNCPRLVRPLNVVRAKDDEIDVFAHKVKNGAIAHGHAAGSGMEAKN